MKRHLRQQGFTLIELMIAGTLGLILVLALAQLFLDNKRNREQNRQLAELQDQGRYALTELGRDLSMAGFWGGIYQGRQITLASSAENALSGANDCGPGDAAGWAFRTTERVDFWDDASEAAVTTRFGCLDNLRSGTDVVAIRRVAGEVALQATTCTNAVLEPFHVYLKTNGVLGTLLRLSDPALDVCTGDAPLQAPVQFFTYLPRVYYIRDFAQVAGDGIPTLCRKTLSQADPAAMVDECVAEGVEDLQIVWGIDRDNDLTQSPDRYTSQPDAAELARAVTAQVFLRVRARDPAPGYSDVKTYAYGDRTGDRAYVPRNAQAEADGTSPRRYYRRVFTTTIQLRNPLP